MRGLEDHYWWYRATHKAILLELKKLPKNAMILDLGCGTGGLMEILNKAKFKVYGVDISNVALQLASSRRIDAAHLLQGLSENMPFKNERFDAITCIDVLCHKKVKNSGLCLKEIYRLLKRDGVLVLQVPAFESLRGGHDVVVETVNRYTKTEIKELFIKAGFKKNVVRYRNCWLFPTLFLWRNILSKNNASDLKVFPKLLNALFYLGNSFDDYLSKFISLPFGTSVFCVAIK